MRRRLRCAVQGLRSATAALFHNALSIGHSGSMRVIGIWTKPLARRTLSLVRGAALSGKQIPKPCLVKEVSGTCKNKKSHFYDLDGPDAQTTSSTSIRTRVPVAVRRTYHLTSKGRRTVLDSRLYWRMCRLGSSTTSSS
jgi:hypothetical protein